MVSLTQAVPQLASVQCIASLASAFEVLPNAILRIDLTKLAETLGTVTVPNELTPGLVKTAYQIKTASDPLPTMYTLIDGTA